MKILLKTFSGSFFQLKDIHWSTDDYTNSSGIRLSSWKQFRKLAIRGTAQRRKLTIKQRGNWKRHPNATLWTVFKIVSVFTEEGRSFFSLLIEVRNQLRMYGKYWLNFIRHQKKASHVPCPLRLRVWQNYPQLPSLPCRYSLA